jgi:hypothetical protein
VNQPANTNSQNENCVMINKTVSNVTKLTFHLFIRMGIQYSFTTTYTTEHGMSPLPAKANRYSYAIII